MATPRLPIPGQDDGTWGDILNSFLTVAHNSDGSIKASALSSKADTSSLATVATSGSYNDLTNKPTIPSVNDATTSTKGIIQLAGDLGGTAASPTVAAINGIAVSGTPANGQVLTATSTTAAAWAAPAAAPVTSVDGQTGAVSLANKYAPIQGPFTKAPLVVDGIRVREGSLAGPTYRATGYNAHVVRNEYSVSQTLATPAQLDAYFKQLRPNSLTRIRAYAPATGITGITWAQRLAGGASGEAGLDAVVAAARKYGQRLIFCFTAWGGDTNADAFVPTTAWVTGQQYLHSVSGSTSYEDWVKTVVTRYASDGTVCIYDLCNEPNDTTGANTAAFRTWFETARSWIQAADPTALVYVGIDVRSQIGGSAAYQSVNANMDLVSQHYYTTRGHVAFNTGGWTDVTALGKPCLIDEIGVFAKSYYGLSSDSDLDDQGLPAVDFGAQGKLLQGEIANLFSVDNIVAALVYSFMDSNGGGFTDGVGHYQPPNEGLARRVVRDADLLGEEFSIYTMTGIASWIDGYQAWITAPGLPQAMVTNRATNSDISPPSGTALLSGRYRGEGGFQLDGTKFLDFGSWKASGTSTSHHFAFMPTALPSSGAFSYLLSPSTAVAGLFMRINNAGKVEIGAYAAATTGTIKATSSNAVNLSGLNTLSVTYNTSTGALVIILNGTRTTVTATATLTAANARIGAAQDGTNGLVGFIFEGMYEAVVETPTNVGRILAYLQRKWRAIG